MYVFEFYFVYKMLRIYLFNTKVNIHIVSCYIDVDMSYKYYLGPEIGIYMYGNKQTLHKMYYVKILLIFLIFLMYVLSIKIDRHKFSMF